MKDYLTHQFHTDDPELVSIIDELPLWSAPFGLKLLDTIKLKPNINVLDLGSGFGFPLIEIAQRLGGSSRVFGIDPWEKAIRRAHLKIRKYHLKNVATILGVAERLPFDNRFFDLVVSNNGINNVEDIRLTLSECYRVCKPDAQFAVTLNKDQIYSKRKPLDETKTLLDETGFRIKNIDEDHFQLKFTDSSAMFNHSLIKYWFLDGWKGILEESDVENIFIQMEEKLDNMAREKGHIKLTIPYVTIDCEIPKKAYTQKSLE